MQDLNSFCSDKIPQGSKVKGVRVSANGFYLVCYGSNGATRREEAVLIKLGY